MICDWSHPGSDRYTGTTEAAIHAFVQIPRPVQDELIARFEKRQIADFVTIDRDSIRGQHGNYDPVVRSMHFGAHGKLCDTVDRSSWSLEHVETALVVCAGGYCVAAPTVCGNWFILGRKEPEVTLTQIEAPMWLPPPVVESATPETPSEPPEMPSGAPDSFIANAAFAPTVGGYLPIVRAVPEPAVWVMLLAGIGVVWGLGSRLGGCGSAEPQRAGVGKYVVGAVKFAV